MDIKPTIWQDIATDNHQNKDIARHLLNYILMNMIIFKPSAVSCRYTCEFYDTFLDIHRGISHGRVYSFFHWNAFRMIFFCIQYSNACNTNIHCFLKAQSCKLYNNKYMFGSTQIRSTDVFGFVAILVFKL